MLFKGSAVALVTPFNEDGVDFEKLGHLVEYHIKNNTDALVVCGTTGEATTMSDEEQLSVIKYVVDKTNKRAFSLVKEWINKKYMLGSRELS